MWASVLKKSHDLQTMHLSGLGWRDHPSQLEALQGSPLSFALGGP